MFRGSAVSRLLALLLVVMSLGAGHAWALVLEFNAEVSLSAKDGTDYVQSITVNGGENVVLAFRITDVTDLAWWSLTLNKRFEDDPDVEFISVEDGLPNWFAADSGSTGSPDYYYLAGSFPDVGDEFTGSGDMGLITIRPLQSTTVVLGDIELLDSETANIPYDLGPDTVTIQVVPEPATVLLVAGGFVALLARKSRKNVAR